MTRPNPHCRIVIGAFEMKSVCISPYPSELSKSGAVFVCEFCLQPFASHDALLRHAEYVLDLPSSSHAHPSHPPGTEIFRDVAVSLWEVDGKHEQKYCQHLCLLAKNFLDHKTLHVDVEPFRFYVLTTWDAFGAHVVGYFSKEKESELGHSVSCILTLPAFQRRGFGRLLIHFSYLLVRRAGRVGSPEQPLSNLGLLSYRDYWASAVHAYLARGGDTISLRDMGSATGIAPEDLVSTLQALGLVKYWRGTHVVVQASEAGVPRPPIAIEPSDLRGAQEESD